MQNQQRSRTQRVFYVSANFATNTTFLNQTGCRLTSTLSQPSLGSTQVRGVVDAYQAGYQVLELGIFTIMLPGSMMIHSSIWLVFRLRSRVHTSNVLVATLSLSNISRLFAGLWTWVIPNMSLPGL